MLFKALRNYLKDKILRGHFSEAEFETLAIEIFEYQYKYNAFYQRYCSLMGTDLSKISKLTQIPFLPIQFFKNQTIQTGIGNPKPFSRVQAQRAKPRVATSCGSWIFTKKLPFVASRIFTAASKITAFWDSTLLSRTVGFIVDCDG